MPALTDTDRDILALESYWFRFPGAKDQAIRDTFDWSATRYYFELNRLIDRPEALAFDPFTVRRLQRLRDSRRVDARRA